MNKKNDPPMNESTVILNDNDEQADTEFVSGRDQGKDQDYGHEKNKGEKSIYRFGKDYFFG